METYIVEGKHNFQNVCMFHLPRGDVVQTHIGVSIKKARLAAGLTQQQLAKAMGVTRPTVTMWESGATTPSTRKLDELADALGLSRVQFFESKEVREASNVRSGPETARWVPEISWINAGAWKEVGHVIEDLTETQHWPCPVACSPKTFCLRVEGDSMSPAYPRGTLIYVDPEVPPTSGKRVVAMSENWEKATFKQYLEDGDERYLKAMNPNWPQQYMPITPDCSIIGTVVFSGRED